MNKQKFISGDFVRLKTKKHSGEIYKVIVVVWDGFSNRNIYHIENINYPYNSLSKFSYELEKATIINPEKDNSAVTLEFDKTTLNTIDSANKFKNCANKVMVDGVVIKNRYGDVDENTRAFKLTLEEAQEMYNAGGKLREFVLRVFDEDELNPKPQVPRSWDEYCKDFYPFEHHMHYTPNFAHGFHGDDCDALIAYGKLIRLRRAWIGNWKPDYNKNNIYGIVYDQKPKFDEWPVGPRAFSFGFEHTIIPLTFPTLEMAQEFCKCFENFLIKAKGLY